MTIESLLKPDDRVIMISGASRGIGAAIAKHLVAEDYQLSLGVRSPEKVTELLDKKYRERVSVSRFEATDPETAMLWIEETNRAFGRIDGLVNNAGILREVNFETGDEKDLDEMWAVNVKAPFRIRSTFGKA